MSFENATASTNMHVHMGLRNKNEKCESRTRIVSVANRRVTFTSPWARITTFVARTERRRITIAEHSEYAWLFEAAARRMFLTSINAELLQLQAFFTPRPPRLAHARWHPPPGANHSRPQPPAADVSNLLLISSYSVWDELLMTCNPGACRILTLSN